MLPTTASVNGDGHHQSYGSVSQLSKFLWSARKFLRLMRMRLGRENKVKLTLYLLFFLANVFWLGSNLVGMRGGGENRSESAASTRNSFGHRGNDPAGGGVWGAAPTTRHRSGQKHGKGGEAGDGGGERKGSGAGKRSSYARMESMGHQSSKSKKSSHASALADGSGEISVNDNVISARGEMININAKRVFVNTRKDPDSDLVIAGGSLHFGSLDRSIESIQCTEERRGTVAYTSGKSSSDPDQVMACLKASTGVFEWTSLVSPGGAHFRDALSPSQISFGGRAAASGSDFQPSSLGYGGGKGGSFDFVREFDVGGTHPVQEGQSVSFVGGVVHPGISLHLGQMLDFGKEDLLTSPGSLRGTRRKIKVHALSSKRFLLVHCNSVGDVHMQMGKFTGQNGITESVGAVLNSAKISFSKGGKVDDIEILMLGEDHFIVAYTEYQSGGRLMAIAGEVLRDDIVSFGVPLEVTPSGARYISLSPVSANKIGLVFTRLKQHEDAKKGGCLVILDHNPAFKHLELDSGKGECVASIGTMIDALTLALPTNSFQTSVAKDVRLVVAYRDLVSRTMVVQYVTVHENAQEDKGKGRGVQGQAMPDTAMAAAGNQTQASEGQSKYLTIVGTPLPIHDFAVRLTDLHLSVLSSAHVVVTYSDKRNAGLFLIDVTSPEKPSVAIGPYVFQNNVITSLSAHVRDHRTLLLSYSMIEPVPMSAMVKISINTNVGSGEIHAQNNVVHSKTSSHTQIIAMDSDEFLYAFLLGAQKEGDGALGTGGIIAGAFGHVIGIAAAEAMPGGKVPVVLSGVSNHHRGLYPGQCYYASQTGMPTLTKTATPLGLSVSDTEILLFSPGCRQE